LKERLIELFAALQQKLSASLGADRKVFTHPVARGDGAEINWVAMLANHLTNRYRVDKAFVIDAQCNTSEQIDVVIYDLQYTPVLYNQEQQRFIPAESVYAVFEVKQTIDKPHIEYAAKKAASVRALARTSATIVHAGGVFEPKAPIPILSGILAFESSWKPSFGNPLLASLQGLKETEHIDIGCAVQSGSFEAAYKIDGTVVVQIAGVANALVYFFIRLLDRLQSVGTVTAIDYSEHAKAIAR
jgi:hypothetical protein